MIKTLLLISMLILSGGLLKAQIGTHKVLQTQCGKNLNSFNVIQNNPVLKKIVQKRKGIGIYETSGREHFVSWDDIEVVNFGQNEYLFDFAVNDKTYPLYYRPSPYKTSDKKLHHGIIKMQNSDMDSTESFPYCKVIFLEDAKKKKD
jgi:hypothetical protein